MPPTGTTNLDKFLKQLEIGKLSLEELEALYGKLLERVWSHETSFERLTNLQEKAKNSEKELNELLEQRNDLLAQSDNKDRIEAIQDLIKLEKEYEKIKRSQFTNENDFLKAQFDKLDEIDQLKQKINNTFSGGLTDCMELYKDFSGLENKIHDKSLEHIKNSINAQKEFNKRQEEGITILDDFAEGLERRTKTLQKGVGEVTKGVKQIGTAGWGMLEPWRKANQEAMTYARSVGMSQRTAEAYLTRTASWARDNNIGLLFNKTTDELIKMQGKYSEVLGRNVQLTSEQKVDMLAMEKFLGEDGTMDIANNLENFGLGMSDSAEFIKETIDDATKYGIHAAKLTKTVRENIKMAQNYTFKDGLRGLENMAKKATALKTDMTLVAGFADKVSTVEGAITTGAQLQVLGGSYAIGSDPLSMLYESLSDMEGLFDRAVGMAKGKVFYNEQTGQMEMGAMDRYFMKQAATSMGVDYGKMMDVAFRQGSLGMIEAQAKGNANISGDNDMMELVKNLATIENGRAVIDIGGRKVDVGKDLTGEDKEALQALSRTESENLADMAVNLRSMNEKVEGIQKESLNIQTEMVNSIAMKFDDLLENTRRMENIARLMAMGRLLMGGYQMIQGGFMTLSGALRGFMGGYNAVSNGSPKFLGRRGGLDLLKRAKTAKKLHPGLGPSTGKVLARTLGGSLGAGAIGAALPLAMSLMNGEFQKDPGSAVGDALGTGIGGAIGMFLGGPMGAMLGSTIGQIVTDGIQKGLRNRRDKIRQSLADALTLDNEQLAQIFEGPNAIVGNYNKKQLEAIKAAIEDGEINADDNLNRRLVKKLRSNDDLARIQAAGVNVSSIAQMANGGYLEGPSHKQGGMPILGSNVVVEGGEFVVNKEATKQNFPLLTAINNNTFTAKEPLGKQMKVHQGSSLGMSMPHNVNGKQDININLSGTIKLDMGGKNLDITDKLLADPQFISQITNMIGKQMNIYDNGSFLKGGFKQKYV